MLATEVVYNKGAETVGFGRRIWRSVSVERGGVMKCEKATEPCEVYKGMRTYIEIRGVRDGDSTAVAGGSCAEGKVLGCGAVFNRRLKI
jgi:hypothetical protein